MRVIAEEGVRSELGAWLASNWSPELALSEWRRRLADSGWGCPSWPVEWHGRGLSLALGDVVQHEFNRVGAVGIPQGPGPTLAGATLLEYASDEQKRRFLRPIITGEDTWCQLFSEPGSGSDLAGLTTRADLDDEGRDDSGLDDSDWVVNGQKVWTTSAHHARYGMLLARTNWDVPKHRGITYFVIDMRQPGVAVRPLRQMNGHASFNEVFFTNARVSSANVIGAVGNGWAVALATLAHERRMNDIRRGAGHAANARGRVYDEYRAETASVMEPYKWYPQRAGRLDLVVERAQATGRDRDPVVRQAIAKLLILARTAEWTARRARAARLLGRPPGPEGSLGKLAASQIARACSDVHTLITGAAAMLAGADAPLDGVIAEVLISVPAVSIAGGKQRFFGCSCCLSKKYTYIRDLRETNSGNTLQKSR